MGAAGGAGRAAQDRLQLQPPCKTALHLLLRPAAQDGTHAQTFVLRRRYADRLPNMPVILLTNDAGNLAAARALGLTAMSLPAYTRSRAGDAPELQDLVARQVGRCLHAVKAGLLRACAAAA